MFGGDDEELNEDGETAAEAAATKARLARMELARKLKEVLNSKNGTLLFYFISSRSIILEFYLLL